MTLRFTFRYQINENGNWYTRHTNSVVTADRWRLMALDNGFNFSLESSH